MYTASQMNKSIRSTSTITPVTIHRKHRRFIYQKVLPYSLLKDFTVILELSHQASCSTTKNVDDVQELMCTFTPYTLSTKLNGELK